MLQFKILHRHTKACLYVGYGESLRNADLSYADLRDADLRDADMRGHKLIGDRPLFQIGPLGSRADTLMAWTTEDGVYISTGCFFGSMDEFEATVTLMHGASSPHGAEYHAAIRMIKDHAAAWGITEAAS